MTDEKALKKLKRSELLEIILLLKEREKTLREENENLTEQLEKFSERIAIRENALKMDNVLGAAFSQVEEAYFEFQKLVLKYQILIEEVGADLVEKKLCANKGLDVFEKR